MFRPVKPTWELLATVRRVAGGCEPPRPLTNGSTVLSGYSKHLRWNSPFAPARSLPFRDWKLLGDGCRAISVAFALAEQDGGLSSPKGLEDVQYGSPPVGAGRVIPVVARLA